MITIAIRIRAIPTHWLKITVSPKMKKAIITETGSSTELMMLPQPQPCMRETCIHKQRWNNCPKKRQCNSPFGEIPKLKSWITLFSFIP